jgi:antirestriction protein ArdC
MGAGDLKNISYMVAQGLHDRTRQQLNFPVRETHLSAKKIEAPAKASYQDQVAEKIIKQLEAGTAPWQRPWGDASESGLPMNPISGNRYKGINVVQLLSESRADPRWLTYKQTQDLGAQVRKGEKGTVIQYWQFPDKSSTSTNANASPEKLDESKQYLPFVKHFVVFNAEQIDGLPPLEVKAPTWDVVARAENIVQASGADIRHAEQERAVYMPKADYILLPNKTQFADAHLYYATALHELSHWTGHESRLARDLSGDRSSENYAREELRAEISSMLMGAEVGLGHDPSNHLSYVASWVKAIKSDPAVIFKAAADAEKIQTFLLAKELEFNAKKQLTTKESAPSLVTAHKSEAGIAQKTPYIAGKEAHAQRFKPSVQAKPLQPSKGLKI